MNRVKAVLTVLLSIGCLMTVSLGIAHPEIQQCVTYCSQEF